MSKQASAGATIGAINADRRRTFLTLRERPASQHPAKAGKRSYQRRAKHRGRCDE